MAPYWPTTDLRIELPCVAEGIPEPEWVSKEVYFRMMTWKLFPYYWPFVWINHRSRWIPLTKGQLCGALMVFFYLSRNKLLNKQFNWRWFKRSISPTRHWNINFRSLNFPAPLLYFYLLGHQTAQFRLKKLDIYSFKFSFAVRDLSCLFAEQTAFFNMTDEISRHLVALPELAAKGMISVLLKTDWWPSRLAGIHTPIGARPPARTLLNSKYDMKIEMCESFRSAFVVANDSTLFKMTAGISRDNSVLRE